MTATPPSSIRHGASSTAGLGYSRCLLNPSMWICIEIQCLLSVQCLLQARRAVDQRERALTAGGSTFPCTWPERWCPQPGAKRRLFTGWGQRLTPQVETSVETLPEGSDVACTSGGGAPLEGRLAIQGGKSESSGCAARPPGCVPATLLQGSSAGKPTEVAAGDSRQQ